MTSSEISENIDRFINHKQALHCIHAKTALKLASEEFDLNSVPECDDEEQSIDLLSTSTFLAVHGLQQLIWLNFKANCWEHNQIQVPLVHLCEVCTTQDLTEEIIPQLLDADGDHESYRSIPYPLSEQLKSIHDSLEFGEQQFPLNLFPPLRTCTHGNRYERMCTFTECIYKFKLCCYRQYAHFSVY